jgi:hypothetical protein
VIRLPRHGIYNLKLTNRLTESGRTPLVFSQCQTARGLSNDDAVSANNNLRYQGFREITKIIIPIKRGPEE